MDLTSKLRRFLPPKSDEVSPVLTKSHNLDPFLHGQEVDTPFGTTYVAEEKWPLNKRHGHWLLKTLLETDYECFKASVGEFTLEDLLFLDTETTGLAGGTGTYAFLVGLGYMTPTHLVVKQLLMRDYNEELALLYLLDQELQKRDYIVSFNGKTFDLPLLQTRFTISRLGLAGVTGKKQIDLLHMSRRFWKYRLSSCSLGSLERHILGVQRVDDIPGMEIPGRYFEFLQTGNGELLRDILEHNVLDIVSMATLLYRLQITTELAPDECDCSFEAEALGHLSLLRGELQSSLPYFRTAAQLTEDEQQYLRVMRQAAAVLKRLGQFEQALQFWRRILEIVPDDLVTSEEVAKYYEHKKKDLISAEQVTRRALALAWQKRSPKAPALEHRLKRIERKARASTS